MITDEAQRVKNALLEHRLETPLIPSTFSDDAKREKIESLMTEVIQTLGLDLTDDSLQDTPKRIAKMYVNEVFGGLNYHNFPNVVTIENSMGLDEMVKVSNISLTSTCEHHFVVIDGSATVAYIPNKKIIGLSKINRLVQFFAQRPQVQERLTQQILVALQTLVDTSDVAVTIEATHYCVKARGVKDTTSSTRTTALGGVFKSNIHTRAEFLKSR